MILFGKKPNARLDVTDIVLFALLTLWGILITIPFINALAISFTSYKEYLETPLLLFPQRPEFKAYRELFKDNRLLYGYRTSLTILLVGVPLSIFLSASMGFALSRKNWPGRKFFFLFILFTMIFQGGIVPLYLVVRSLHLTNTIWSVVFTGGINTFYMILIYNFFQTLPESLVESARLDGAGDWTILFRIVMPLSMPILATITLFYTVDKWNEWFNAMVFIRNASIQPLQLVLRSIVLDSVTASQTATTVTLLERPFPVGIKMAAVMITMLPIMCIYPFLQKHFAKGMMVGAIKA
ncbi:MAG: carbohydrate ABC transporter permease [Treponema sp.]|jgi:putative aldouronate transport system permease protein|nr:carbohydrate ABC transporter permease [Treponema sp.]